MVGSTLIDTGQSCLIAALAGTSREGIEQIMAANGGQEPVGSNEKGKECIARHLTQFGAKPPAMLTSNTGKFKACSSRICITKRALNCQPYMNLFARGTAELGSLGQIIGPTLSRALAKSNGTPIVTAGLTYDADRAGINCLGMSGGVKCIEQLQQMAKQCPESQFFLSGYSQGAMVARICAAYSSKEIQQRIKVWQSYSPCDFALLIEAGYRYFWRPIQWRNSEGSVQGCNQGFLQWN